MLMPKLEESVRRIELVRNSYWFSAKGTGGGVNDTIQRPPEHARRLNENAKEVGSEDELLNYLRHRVLSDYGLIMFSRVLNVNVTIKPEEYAGDRTGWNRWHYVCVNGGVVGMCNIEEAVI